MCSFSTEDVWDIYDLRAVLEGHAARRAAGRITVSELGKVAGADGGDGGARRTGSRITRGDPNPRRAQQEFHGIIVEASRNRRLRGSSTER